MKHHVQTDKAVSADNDCAGAGWTKYKDEKCLKIVGVGTQGEGQLACLPEMQSLSESLLHVANQEEQEFVSQWIVDNYVEKYQNVSYWLAARQRINRIFQQNADAGEKIDEGVAPWEKSHQISKRETASDKCVQIDPLNGVSKIVPCDRKNLIICQKPQRWTFQQWATLRKTAKELNHLSKETKEQVEGLERGLGELREEFEKKITKAISKSQKSLDGLEEPRGEAAKLSKELAKFRHSHESLQMFVDDLRGKYDELEELLGIMVQDLDVIKGTMNSG